MIDPKHAESICHALACAIHFADRSYERAFADYEHMFHRLKDVFDPIDLHSLQREALNRASSPHFQPDIRVLVPNDLWALLANVKEPYT